MNQRRTIRDTKRAQNNREELVERIAQALPEDGALDVFPGFRLARSSKTTRPVHAVYEPSFCIVVQGCKHAMLGEEVFRYDQEHYLIYTVDLPLTFQVEEASKERPYLGFRLNLDPAVVAAIMMEFGAEPKKGHARVKAIDVSPMDADLLDAAVRLVRLIDVPDARKVLAPLITREIVFRLLTGGQGARLGHLLVAGGGTGPIAKAIGHLRKNFDQPLSMEELAHELGMSLSGFHHQFKTVTAMSPLQFQKQIRLQQARSLMLSEDLDAASAGFRVGYEDPAYFSRDYKKMFGAPPHRDITQLRSSLEV